MAKRLKKINIKIEISVHTPALNVGQFGELQICIPNLPKNITNKHFEIIKIKAYGNVSLYQISANLENLRFRDQISPPKKWMTKILKKQTLES